MCHSLCLLTRLQGKNKNGSKAKILGGDCRQLWTLARVRAGKIGVPEDVRALERYLQATFNLLKAEKAANGISLMERDEERKGDDGREVEVEVEAAHPLCRLGCVVCE